MAKNSPVDSMSSKLYGMLDREHMGEPIVLLLAYMAMYAPTYVRLDQEVWGIVGQGHGPVILILVLWLFWRRGPAFVNLPNDCNRWASGLMLVLGVLFYVVGRSQDILMLDVTSQIFVLSAIILGYRGWRGLRMMLFPLFFVIFLIPMPSVVVDALTGPLKAGVSYVAEALLYMLGYPIARSGVTLTIGQYRLLVADACAGLNSLFALEAIGIFYMGIVEHSSRLRNMLLATFIVPISFVSNVARVMILVLITYYFGDEAGQGFVHGFAGILLFVLAIFLMIGVDSAAGLLFRQDVKS